MKNQEIFETVSRHLFAQGERAYTTASGCLYRGPNGTKCAVGFLIPDEEYDTFMEGNGVTDIVYSYKYLKRFKRNLPLLKLLQNVHDSVYNWTDTVSMRRALHTVGKEHKLPISFLNELSFKDR